MKGGMVDIGTEDGAADAYLARPSTEDGSHPGAVRTSWRALTHAGCRHRRASAGRGAPAVLAIIAPIVALLYLSRLVLLIAWTPSIWFR